MSRLPSKEPIPTKVQEFLNFEKVNSVRDSTLKDHKSKLLNASRFKPLISWNQKDMTGYILQMKNEGYADSFIESTKFLLKKFFTWLKKPKVIEGIKVKNFKRKLKSTEILTPDDVDKLIETANNNRDKALIAFIFESGARINEILSIKVKDLQETEAGLKVLIPATKTGEDYRPCLCVHSGQYIRNHVLYPALKPDDYLFDMSKVSVWLKLKELAKIAEIDKPISAHKFRHAQATYMVRKGYQESIIRAKLGWTDDSRMIARYVSIDKEKDVHNATLQIEGSQPVIDKELIKGIKIAAPIAIADSSLELNRLQQDNEALKNQVETMRKDMEKIQEFIKLGGMELLKKG